MYSVHLTGCSLARGAYMIQTIKTNSEYILLIHPSLLAFDVSLQQFSSRGTETLCVITSDNAINSHKNFPLRHHIYVS